MKRSCGILVYKKENNEYKIFLAHMGGPYWENVEEHSWSIPKGEKEKNETTKKAAKREFNEETNLTLSKEINYLASKKVSNNKLIIIFTTDEIIDITNCKSNFFEKDINGVTKLFPEMDRYEWFTLEEAKNKILNNQLYFIRKFEDKIKRS